MTLKQIKISMIGNESSNEETTESTAEQLEEDSSDDFPNGEDVDSALDDDADKDEE